MALEKGDAMEKEGEIEKEMMIKESEDGLRLIMRGKKRKKMDECL